MTMLPRALFILSLLLIPATALAVHDDPGKTKCLECHETLPFDRTKLVYTETIGGVCRRCHPSYPCDGKDANALVHPIEVMVPDSMTIPIDMPLDKAGRLTCVTCHSFHAEFWDAEYDNEALLRRAKGMKLCYTCHKTLPGLAP